MSSSAETLYLIDSHSLIFQVFHAIPMMSSPTGLATNAIFGFTRDVIFLREKKPDYLVAVFDAPGKVFREDIYPDYKANRGPMPDDLQPQIGEIQRMLEAMRVPVLSKPGYEADDLVATVARAGGERGMRIFLCTSDKDCRQLIRDNIKLYNLRKHQEFGREELLADWGITPEQVIDLQAMVGDSVDNIPGIPGIGIKTAAKLLQDFGTLEGVLANIDKISGAKRQENLRAAGPIVEKSRQLVRLDDHVDIPMDWDAWRLQPANVPTLLALFREWGFRGFADQVRKWPTAPGAASAGTTAAAVSGKKPRQRGLFDDDELNGQAATADHQEIAETKDEESGTKDNWQATYQLVDTAEKLDAFVKELGRQQRFAFDLETTSLEPRRAAIVGFAFSWQAGVGWYLPIRGPEGDMLLNPVETLDRLKPIFENPAIAKVNQNIKYEVMVLRQHGIHLAGLAGDPMVADYLLHAGERSHGMDELSRRYLHHSPIPITDLIGKGKSQLCMDQVPTTKVAEYAGEDADVAWRLTELLEPQLAGPGLQKLYHDVEIPLIEVLAELEFNGIRLDVPLLHRLSEEMAQQLQGIEKEIYALAGREFNIASPQQMRQVLFDELKLPRQRRTGITGEASTAQETLERLAALGHSLPRKIVEHRQVAKLKGTYVDALPGLVNPDTRRIHASFNQTVAATGRLSSSDPNLQNIPVRTEMGKQIRQAFVPQEGWLLLTADYSQIELRLLAHLCGDANLKQAFVDDRDIHASVASQIFGTPENEVTSEMRRAAKTVNFGVIYGISAFGLAQRLGITKEEAAQFIDAYFAKYPKVLEYQDRLLANCRKTGFVGTMLSRRREITGIRPKSTYAQRNQPEREAVNMEIQGSAADLLKLAMLAIYRRLKAEKRQSRMLLTVHDELVFETPPEELEETAGLVNEEMATKLERQLKIDVPLKVDIAAGENWLDVEEITRTAATSGTTT